MEHINAKFVWLVGVFFAEITNICFRKFVVSANFGLARKMDINRTAHVLWYCSKFDWGTQ